MAEATQEDLKKCGFCKKTAKRQKRYYRNGKYYCNMNCWTKAKKAAAEEKGGSEEAAEE